MADDPRSDTGAPADAAFTVTVNLQDRRAVVLLAGELDADGCGRLTGELGKVMTPTIDRIDVDASDLDFVDSAGLQTLLSAAEEAQARSIELRVTAVSPLVRRVVQMAGLTSVLLVDES